MAASENDEEDLEFTRNLRKDLIRGCLPDDKLKYTTTDPVMISLALKAMADLDKVALTRMKIRSEEGISDKKTQAAEALAKIFMDPDMANRAKPQILDLGAEDVRVIPTLDVDLPEPDILPGEFDTAGGGVENWNSFMERVNPEALR